MLLIQQKEDGHQEHCQVQLKGGYTHSDYRLDDCQQHYDPHHNDPISYLGSLHHESQFDLLVHHQKGDQQDHQHIVKIEVDVVDLRVRKKNVRIFFAKVSTVLRENVLFFN